MPTPKKIKIDPTDLVNHSENGRLLRGFLEKCRKKPKYHILRKGKTYEYHGSRFFLTHTLHRKEVESGNEFSSYEVIATPPKGQDYAARGNNAFVNESIGVLYPKLDDALVFIPGCERVVKEVFCTKNTNEDLEKQKQELNLELAHSRMGGKLWPKFLFTWQGRLQDRWGLFYSMRKARGCSLTAWLEAEKNKPLDADKLSKVSLALIQALYLQVTRHNTIHCDIKPDNIFIEEVNGEFSVTIIDYGYAMSADKFETLMPVQCTSDYLPPEYKKDANGPKLREAYHNEKFDVYSLGKVLKQVWPADSFSANSPLGKVLEAATREKLDWEKAVREELDRSKQFDCAIQNLIAERPTMHELYYRFLDAMCEAKLKKAHLTGLSARCELDALKTDDAFNRCVVESLNDLEDRPEVIRAYINGLGWDALTFAMTSGHPLQTKAELLNAIQHIQQKRQQAISVIDGAVMKLDNNIEICSHNLHCFSHLKSYAAIDCGFKALKKKYEALRLKFERMPLDLDEVSIKTDRTLHELMSLTDLHDLLHLAVYKPNKTTWVFPKDYRAYQKAATEALAEKVESIIDSNPGAFSESSKTKIHALLENKKFSFEYKRDRLVTYFSSGKYQRMYTEICLAEKRSPVHALESYIVLIQAIETKDKVDPGSAILGGFAKALRAYLESAGNDRSLDLLSRAASQNRLADIRKMHTLILHSSTDAEMVAGLKNILSDMKTGPLGRSLLKHKLNAVIKRYERRKHDMANQTKVIDVTKLNSVDDMHFMHAFLEAHIKKNYMIFANHGYPYRDKKFPYKRKKFYFSHDMIYRGEELVVDGMLDSGVRSPRFSVLSKGAMANRGDGVEVVTKVSGYLELMKSGVCFYQPASHAEVLRFYGPDTNLKSREMKQAFIQDAETINEAYELKKGEPTVPAIRQVIRLVRNNELDRGKQPKDRPARGVCVLQAGTTLKQYLLGNQNKLSDEDRLRLTNAILHAYREQMVKQKRLATYLDWDNIIVSVARDGQYTVDLMGSMLESCKPGRVPESSALNQPMFMHPKALDVRSAPFRDSDQSPPKVNFNRSTDAWSLGRILCTVWDRDNTLAVTYDAKCKASYAAHYETCFETMAFKKIEEKVARRGFIARAWHKFTSLFYNDKDKVKTIQANLSRAERKAIQEQVTYEAIPCIVADEMHDDVAAFSQTVDAPPTIRELLPALLAGNKKALNHVCPDNIHSDNTVVEKAMHAVHRKADEALRGIQDECEKLLSQTGLFQGADLPSVWKDLQVFQAELTANLAAGVSPDQVNDVLNKFKFIKAQILLSTQRFDVRRVEAGSHYSKLLFAYLKSRVDAGVLFFEKDHVFVSDRGVSYKLSHALDARKKEDGSIHYDVLSPLTGLQNASNFELMHSSVFQVDYVLKPGVNESLMCVRKTDDKHQKNRRLVKYNLDGIEGREEATKECERLDVFGVQFKAKNNNPGSFNQKCQSGVPYCDLVNQDAQSNDDAFKRKRFLALVRAFYVQVELNGVKYSDLKTDNLILNALPNGEDLFSVIDFEPGRINGYGGLFASSGQPSTTEFRRLAGLAFNRQPLFGLGVVLAQLYCGLRISQINLATESDFNRLMVTVNNPAINMPNEIRTLINELLDLTGKSKIGNVGELLSQAYSLSLGDDARFDVNKKDAYFFGCELKGQLLKCQTKEMFVVKIKQGLNQLAIQPSAEVIHEFIRGLGFAVLIEKIDQLNTHDELMVAIDLIFSYKDNMLAEWTKKKDALSNLVRARELDVTLLHDKQLPAVVFASREAETKMNRINAHYQSQCDLDEIADANTRLLGLSMREFNRLHRSAVQLADRLAPRVQSTLLAEAEAVAADPIKQQCALVLKDYTKQKGSTTLSARRQGDIARLRTMIEGAEGDVLKQQITEYVKGSLAGGMFGKRSVFKGKLAASLLKVTKAPGMGRG